MIKVCTALPRRSDHTIEAFQHHWGTIHRDHALRIDRIDRYVQSHRVPITLPGTLESAYDGFPEVWFRDLGTALALAHDPQYLDGAHVDEPHFADTERIARTWVAPHLARPWAGFAEAVSPGKVLLLLATDPGEVEEVGRAVEQTSALRIMCSPALDDARVAERQAFGVVVELWWSDEQTALDSWHAEHVRLLDEVGRVADLTTSTLALVREHRVRWPGPYDPEWS